MPIDRRDFLKMLGAASAISAAFPGLHADPVEGLRVVEAERSRRDPVALMRAATGFEPDPWQVRLLRSGAERMLVNCHRQAGKSTATSALAIHTAIARPDSLVLIISAAQRQAGELFRKVVDAYEALDKPIPAVEDNAVTLALENGSRIVSLPSSETTIRGYSAPRLVIVDEAARVMDAVSRAAGRTVDADGQARAFLAGMDGGRGRLGAGRAARRGQPADSPGGPRHVQARHDCMGV
jgi:hypothetical protein